MLRLDFLHISLPQLAVDAVRSQGFVRFHIVPRATLVPGSLIPNRAHIFFDYNAPATTNQVTTLILNPLAVPRDAAVPAFSLYPNPAHDRLTIEASPNATVT